MGLPLLLLVSTRVAPAHRCSACAPAEWPCPAHGVKQQNRLKGAAYQERASLHRRISKQSLKASTLTWPLLRRHGRVHEVIKVNSVLTAMVTIARFGKVWNACCSSLSRTVKL